MAMFRLFRWLRRIATTVVLIVVVSVGATAVWVVGNGLYDNRAPSDAIVVMGAAQFDGTPSPVLRNRLRYAFALYSTGVAPRIITVGGKQPGDRFTEAGSGRAFLRAKGVPASDLVAIGKGRDTYASAQAVAVWARRHGITTLTVVTDRCHVARAAGMLRSLGFSVRGAAPRSGAGSSVTWAYVARETAGLLRFWFVGDRGAAA